MTKPKWGQMLESANSKDFDQCRLWLLDVAYAAYVPLGMIVGNDKYLKFQWNRPLHGASREQLAAEIEKLQQEDFIYFLEAESGAVRSLDNAAILDAFAKKDRELCYGFTAAGGAEWERIVRPTWDWFYEFEMPEELCEYGVFGQFTIRASTREAAEEQFVFEQHRDRIEVESDSVIVKQIHPWPVTYWKTLAEGYELSFRGTMIDSSEYEAKYWDSLSPEARERLVETFKKVVHRWTHWHRPPWPTASA